MEKEIEIICMIKTSQIILQVTQFQGQLRSGEKSRLKDRERLIENLVIVLFKRNSLYLRQG